MKSNKNLLNSFFLIIALIGISNKTYAQKEDVWSGNYIIKSPKSKAIDTIKIQKTADINKEDVASRFESDLSRWIIASKNENYENEIIARRFLFDLENDENEYEQFGWIELYLKGEMKCIDAGHLFICKTKPNSVVKYGDESFFTKTGLFGIRLHYGLFELEKYN